MIPVLFDLSEVSCGTLDAHASGFPDRFRYLPIVTSHNRPKRRHHPTYKRAAVIRR